MKKEDIIHLKFIYNRLALNYGENRQVGYMIKLESIIDKLEEELVPETVLKENKNTNLAKQMGYIK